MLFPNLLKSLWTKPPNYYFFKRIAMIYDRICIHDSVVVYAHLEWKYRCCNVSKKCVLLSPLKRLKFCG